MTRILIVEDEESFAEPLEFLLRKEGFSTAIAATGQGALEEFDRNGADIVLLDLMLPGLPGTEVCRQIRAVSSVPVIMVSAKDDEVDKIVGLELGADDYVTKPYSPRAGRAIRPCPARHEPDLAPMTLEAGTVRWTSSAMSSPSTATATPAAEGVRAARALPPQPRPRPHPWSADRPRGGSDYVATPRPSTST
jgi:CheY-like chemotaxis protein